METKLRGSWDPSPLERQLAQVQVEQTATPVSVRLSLSPLSSRVKLASLFKKQGQGVVVRGLDLALAWFALSSTPSSTTYAGGHLGKSHASMLDPIPGG